jgi:hypothetical protein
MRKVADDQNKDEEKQLKFKINQFNLLVSDMLSLNRSLKVITRAPEGSSVPNVADSSGTSRLAMYQSQ